MDASDESHNLVLGFIMNQDIQQAIQQATDRAVEQAVQRCLQLINENQLNQPQEQPFEGMNGNQLQVRQGAPMTGFPFGSQYVFGLGVDPATSSVRVYNPMLRRYGDPQGTAPNQTICYTCADAEITFSGDGSGQRICWAWSPSAGLSIMPDAQTNDPIDDSTYIYGVVAVFDVTNGVPILAKGGCIQCGQIITLPVFTVAGT